MIEIAKITKSEMFLIVLKILKFMSIYFLMYLIVNHKNELTIKCKQKLCDKNIEKQLKIFKSLLITKTKYFKKLNKTIENFKKIYFDKEKRISSKITDISIIILSITLAAVIYFLIYKIIAIKSTSAIVSIISFFIPYDILKFLVIIKKNKILNDFPEYILNIKRNVKIDNNIIFAFKNTNAPKSIKRYIDKFNISIEKGANVYDSFEILKEDIDISNINLFITIIQNCYIYGGNFEQMLDKYAKSFLDQNIQKEKQKQDVFSLKVAAGILILINIYLAYSFICKNQEYCDILTKTMPGICIINFVILSYLVIIKLLLSDDNEYLK